jgi:hypothetical protein
MMLFGRKKEVKPEIYSEETCQSCGEKSRRPFRDGDYVYRRAEQCKKCLSSNTLITAVYGEYPEEKH